MENEKVCTGNTDHNLFLPKLKSFCSKSFLAARRHPYPSRPEEAEKGCASQSPGAPRSIQSAPPEKGAFPQLTVP